MLHVKFYLSWFKLNPGHYLFLPTLRGALDRGLNAVTRYKNLCAEFFNTLFSFLGYKVLGQGEESVHYGW